MGKFLLLLQAYQDRDVPEIRDNEALRKVEWAKSDSRELLVRKEVVFQCQHHGQFSIITR
jgi:ribosomal protein S24E